MRFSFARMVVILLVILPIGSVMGQSVTPIPARPLPNPNIILVGVEYTKADGKDIVRYKYDVFNREDYPDSMFAKAPRLPPCGTNTNASRTWVDFFDQSGKRLYGFCDLANSKSLSGIWFALNADVVPPSWVYIEMTDRQTDKKYKSNLAETTQ